MIGHFSLPAAWPKSRGVSSEVGSSNLLVRVRAQEPSALHNANPHSSAASRCGEKPAGLLGEARAVPFRDRRQSHDTVDRFSDEQLAGLVHPAARYPTLAARRVQPWMEQVTPTSPLKGLRLLWERRADLGQRMPYRLRSRELSKLRKPATEPIGLARFLACCEKVLLECCEEQKLLPHVPSM
jgi:hypothetical protein